jgi:hypothetical protein
MPAERLAGRMNRKVIKDASVSFDRDAVIRIKYDWHTHSWTAVVSRSRVLLPWMDTADAVSAVLWFKKRTSCAVPVKIESSSQTPGAKLQAVRPHAGAGFRKD